MEPSWIQLLAPFVGAVLGVWVAYLMAGDGLSWRDCYGDMVSLPPEPLEVRQAKDVTAAERFGFPADGMERLAVVHEMEIATRDAHEAKVLAETHAALTRAAASV